MKEETRLRWENREGDKVRRRRERRRGWRWIVCRGAWTGEGVERARERDEEVELREGEGETKGRGWEGPGGAGRDTMGCSGGGGVKD